MLINTDYITPAELTGYVRASVANADVNQFTLSAWLPRSEIDDLDYRFTRGGEGLVEAATFRSYDAESTIGSRPGATRVSGELPPISRKIRLGEYDRLRQRKLEGGIRNAILTDAERMARAVAARLELARGDALVNGTVTINENGVIATIDFSRAAGNTVTAGTPWSTVATATPISDMLAWKATYKANNDGETPGAIVISDQALGYLLRNAEIRTLTATVAGTPAIVSVAVVNALLSAYGLPPVYVYDVSVKVNGATTRVISAGKVLFLPVPGDPDTPSDTQLGATLLGTTAESLEPDFNLDGFEPGIVAGAYSTKDPVAVWTKAAAIGLPVLANPNLSFCATVF